MSDDRYHRLPISLKLLDITNPNIQSFSISADGTAKHRCPICGDTFPQTDEGWNALKIHGFSQHEQGQPYDAMELNGLSVQLIAIEREAEGGYDHEQKGRQVDLWAKADDGTMYSICHWTVWDTYKGDWKWKPKSQNSNLKMLMQREAE